MLLSRAIERWGTVTWEDRITAAAEKLDGLKKSATTSALLE